MSYVLSSFKQKINTSYRDGILNKFLLCSTNIGKCTKECLMELMKLRYGVCALLVSLTENKTKRLLYLFCIHSHKTKITLFYIYAK